MLFVSSIPHGQGEVGLLGNKSYNVLEYLFFDFGIFGFFSFRFVRVGWVGRWVVTFLEVHSKTLDFIGFGEFF